MSATCGPIGGDREPYKAHGARLLTPPGMGAIGVVRVEGADPWPLVAPLLRSAKRAGEPLNATPAPGRVVYARFVDGDEVIDDCLISTVATGDGYAIDVAAHGGVRILERIMQALARQGVTIQPAADSAASVWQAGSRLEAEIIDALGEAKTELAVRFLTYQRAHLVGHLQSVASLCESDVEAAERELTALIGRAKPARLLVEGATIAIIGPPNAGKSSLFNRLVGREAAVVSETPGTTRDWVSADLDWRGVPIHLIDTAGSRETTDALEAEAISSGRGKGRTADVVLVVLDGTDHAGVEAWCARLGDESSNQPRMVVLNKSDCRDASTHESRVRGVCDAWVSVSATSGKGVDRLIAEAVTTLGINPEEMLRPALITRRQVQTAGALRAQLRKAPHQAARSIRRDVIGL